MIFMLSFRLSLNRNTLSKSYLVFPPQFQNLVQRLGWNCYCLLELKRKRTKLFFYWYGIWTQVVLILLRTNQIYCVIYVSLSDKSCCTCPIRCDRWRSHLFHTNNIQDMNDLMCILNILFQEIYTEISIPCFYQVSK